MNNSHLITVIITCYREGELLNRAISSVKCQTVKNFDVLIVNDSSSCEVTNNICADAAQSGFARLITHSRNKGLSSARNTGFVNSNTEICMFLDGDDELPADAVEVTQNAAQNWPDADFIFGDYLLTDVERSTTRRVDCSHLVGPDGRLAADKLLTKWTLSGHCPCKKHVWENIGGYEQRFSYGYQDVDFFMRAIHAGFKGRYVKSCLYHWYRSSEGMNEKRMPRALFYRGYSWRYYEYLGARENYYNDVIFEFLNRRDEREIRQDARKLVVRLLPDKPSRVFVYFKFLLLLCGPMWFSNLLCKMPDNVDST